MKRRLALAGLALALQVEASERQWDFEVLLDGKPIGSHRFTLDTRGDTQVLHSEARFDVKLLSFTVYRYRHEAIEQWQDGCLTGLQASTDDNGRPLRVNWPQGGARPAGCMMSFAYWNPALMQQTRLLNAQTGDVQPVRFTALPDQALRVRGQDVPARHWRLSGPEQAVELWYSPQGEWLGLASHVGGRQLQYTLR
jgi:hypothetical protein